MQARGSKIRDMDVTIPHLQAELPELPDCHVSPDDYQAFHQQSISESRQQNGKVEPSVPADDG